MYLAFTAQSSYSQSKLYEFPNETTNTDSKSHKRIDGTRIYLDYPADFSYNTNKTRLQKKEQQYLEFWETESMNFTEVKSNNYTKEVLTKKGINYEDIHHIKIQNYEGIFSIGDSKDPTEEKIVLSFGDETFYVMIGGVINRNDTEGKKELIKILKTVYFDKEFTLDPLETADFEVDLEKSGFHFNAASSGFFTFSEGSKLELNKDEFSYANFVIGILPKMDISDLKILANEVLSNFEVEEKLSAVNNSNIKNTVIDGNESIILDTMLEGEGKNGILYLAAIKGEKSSMIFMGTAFERLDLLKISFAETVKSLKFKENY